VAFPHASTHWGFALRRKMVFCEFTDVPPSELLHHAQERLESLPIPIAFRPCSFYSRSKGRDSSQAPLLYVPWLLGKCTGRQGLFTRDSPYFLTSLQMEHLVPPRRGAHDAEL
jgi:hypothetical protein